MTTNNNEVVVQGFSEATEKKEPVTTVAGKTLVAQEAPKTTTPAKQAGPDALAALRAQFGATIAGHHFHKGDHMFDAYAEKPVNYVVAKNGMFRVTVKPIGVFASKIGEAPKANSIPGLVDIKEGVTLRIPKIPFDCWLQILSWYRDVHKKDGTEASVLFFWNYNNVQVPRQYAANADGTPGRLIKGITEVGQLIMYCPEQVNSGALSNFTADGMVKWLRENTAGLCETHSHHTMGAFWSGTDDQNENMTQFYGVYGQIFQSSPAFLFRYVHGDDKTNISMWELFEKPKVTTISHVELGGKIIEIKGTSDYSGPWPAIEYPEDWMAQHSKNSYVGTNYGGNGYGGYGAQGRGGSYGSGYGYGGGAHTQHSGSAYGGTGQYDPEDAEEYWWSQPSSHRNRHQARPQIVELEEGKKKETSGAQAVTQSLTNREIVLRKVVDTPTSSVEIISTEALSPWAQDQVEDLIHNLSESGYDHFMMNMVKKLASITG